ncbi:MAG: hypothetical protein HYZ75_17095 [Elusimicrobia bacterium]|nr:hypothetical protein [Elusimicrobiota bacterium]
MRQEAMAQYSVEFPDEPAVHARLTRLLVKEKVPYKSVITIRQGDKTTIQFLAPHSTAMREKLKRIGISVREEQVFELEIPHHPWELHKLARSLAEKDINILSLYSSIEGENMRIVLAVDQTANAMELVRKLGFEPSYPVCD